jgi:hypothetical protein
MGKKANPKVTIDAKNHIENHIILSVSVLLGILVPFYASILALIVPDKIHSQSL